MHSGARNRVLASYLGFFAAGLVGAVVLWCALLILQAGAPSASSRWTAEIYARKSAIAERTASPKLLIVGGSSVHFGISARMISDATGRAAVNFGTHGGLPLDYLLHRVRMVAEPGDTVLLALEYGYYFQDDRVNRVAIDYLWSRDPGYLRRLAPRRLVAVLATTSLGRLVTGLLARLLPSDETPRGPVGRRYDARTTSAFGDETRNREEAVTPRMRRRIRDSAKPFRLSRRFDAGRFGPRQIAAFAGWSRERGVRLLATWQSKAYKPTPRDAETVATLEDIAAFLRGHGITVLGNPWEFLYEAELFFDTETHLTDRGRRLRTDRLIQLLRSQSGQP